MEGDTASTLAVVGALIAAGAVAAQLVVLIVAAVFAKRQVDEARTLREAQARPFVVIDFHVEGTLIFLTITNTGPSLAHGVQLTFDPPPRSSRDEGRPQLPPFAETRILTDGIPSLAPGKVISALFDHFPAREQKREAGSDLPDSYTVWMKYAGEPLGRVYEEETVIDIGIYRDLVHVRRHDLHDIHERLKEIKSEVHKWTAFGGGLHTVTEDKRQRDEEREARYRALEAAESETTDAAEADNSTEAPPNA